MKTILVVEGAASGRSAMRELDNYVPDLIVLDVGLPDVDGLELLHRWRREERTRAMPVIIVTGHIQTVRGVGYRFGQRRWALAASGHVRPQPARVRTP